MLYLGTVPQGSTQPSPTLHDRLGGCGAPFELPLHDL